MGQLTDEGFENDRGDLIYWPAADGAIQVRDVDGDSLGLFEVDDEHWPGLARAFGLTRDDFPECAECDVRHSRGGHVSETLARP